jgi:nicotinamidase/pyrazinamidase
MDQQAPVVTGLSDVLIVVDVQNCFCPGGALEVPEGDQVIAIVNRLIPMFGRWIFTRDWHPANHCSFSAHPGFRDQSWPPHCVQNTEGALFCAGLEIPLNAILVSKGTDARHEAYSGFQAENFDLAAFLRGKKVERVFLTGLATDYCVRQTALDARQRGFDAFLVEDATRGVAPDTTARALADMEAAGVVRIRASQISDSGERPRPAYDDDGNPLLGDE